MCIYIYVFCTMNFFDIDFLWYVNTIDIRKGNGLSSTFRAKLLYFRVLSYQKFSYSAVDRPVLYRLSTAKVNC